MDQTITCSVTVKKIKICMRDTHSHEMMVIVCVNLFPATTDVVHSLKNNLTLCVKTEPVTAGADATDYIRFLFLYMYIVYVYFAKDPPYKNRSI